MIEKPPPGDEQNEEFWRAFLLRGSERERRNRFIYRHIPSNPRCRLCAAPFGGIGRPIMRAIGKRPAEGNPNLCSTCFTFVTTNHGGAEIPLSLLFADVRGSTALAETMSPSEYRSLLARFYDAAASAVFDNDGFLDKFVGDEVVAIFAPLLTGERHSERAVAAARQLMEATGHGTTDRPWLHIGAGVHTGQAWMGAVGEGSHRTMTALGDVVNVAARLASAAAAGEVLVTTAAATAAGLDPALPRRELELRGKQAATTVVSLRFGEAAAVR
ncbi:MAG TPA: adenylate/guanylate cyclase domain-containing protein [Candidatus Limnocylindria bacterium]|nr:adenylate/guanylate cyclase domain-containing protein [Candidatus Limnocylindria bacterium]